MELHNSHRPSLLKHLIGQPDVVATVKKWVGNGGIPHAVLLTGTSGSGKTTLARILKQKVGCADTDYHELNAADDRGVSAIRDIRARMHLKGLKSGNRMWLLDEVHGTTTTAQEAMLKLLESPPDHVYFVLATTEPSALTKTVRSRCTELALKPLSAADLRSLVERVVGLERKGYKLPDAVLDKVVDNAGGSARQALNDLGKVLAHDGEAAQLASVVSPETETAGIEVARLLLKGCPWAVMAKVLKEVKEEPETIRHVVLSYMTSVLLNGKADKRVCAVIGLFSETFIYNRKAGLVSACFQVLHAGK